jgi:hypothetical protein
MAELVGVCSVDKYCRVGKFTINGSLVEPVALDPVPIPPPQKANTPGCRAASEEPIWKLENIVFTSSQSNLVNWWFMGPPQLGNVELNITNKANGFLTVCRQSLSFPAEANKAWVACFLVPRHTYPKFVVETYMRFSPLGYGFEMNQTWFCEEDNSDHAYDCLLSTLIALQA